MSVASVLACKGVLKTYSASLASVAEMREYAYCVGHVYPGTMSPDAVFWLKTFIVLGLLGALWGVVCVARGRAKDVPDYIACAFFGMVATPAAAAVCVGVYFAISFLIFG